MKRSTDRFGLHQALLSLSSPIFEEDTPSVMEIEMEELDKWMNSMNRSGTWQPKVLPSSLVIEGRDDSINKYLTIFWSGTEARATFLLVCANNKFRSDLSLNTQFNYGIRSCHLFLFVYKMLK